jgi:para-nitrobenzyl esterase|tara:strand:+ start:9536 stop:10756 length:1221 start_codon:yes stop_codon:yes gene_type:complete
MRKVAANLFLLLSVFTASAQIPSCDGSRFIDSVFTEVKDATTLQYGSNVTIGGVQQDLFMDVFEPLNDSETPRPLIILAFGGSFITGERSDMNQIAIDYAMRGYVAATIDYRIYDKLAILDSAKLLDVVVKGVGDMKASVRYFKEDFTENGNTFNIDTNYIFVGGASSGAILANHVGLVGANDNVPEYFQSVIDVNGGWEGNSSENTSYSSSVTGVISFSGAIKDVAWIDENDVPVFAAHDYQDPVVPYERGLSVLDFGSLQVPLMYISGGKSIIDALKEKNVYSELVTVETAEHVSYLTGTSVDSHWNLICTKSAAFIEEIICTTTWSVDEHSVSFNVFPNPASGFLTINANSKVDKLTVYDLMGQVVLTSSNENSINVDGLNAGYYYLSVHADGKTGVQPIMVK